MDKCLHLADWDGFRDRRAAAEAQGKLRGRAVAYYIESGGRFNERMELRFDPSGAVTVLAGTHSHGQGHETTYTQLIVELLGLPFESIRFIQGDTSQVSYGRGTYAARSSMAGGDALRLAALRIIDQAKPMAAHLLEAAISDLTFEKGSLRVAGTDRAISLPDVAKAFYRAIGTPEHFGASLEASGASVTSEFNHPNGCHVCEVLVDPETGVIQLDRYTIVDYVGVVINPMICEGQIHGGLAQGIGQALMEHIIYERESGQLLSGSFSDYAMPRADDMPQHLQTAFEEIPSKSNALGVKGVGEAGAVPSPTAIISAVLDALRPLGVRDIQMPATPFRVWQAIQDAKAERRQGQK